MPKYTVKCVLTNMRVTPAAIISDAEVLIKQTEYPIPFILYVRF